MWKWEKYFWIERLKSWESEEKKVKGIIVKSDYSDKNCLELLEKEDGDIVIKTIIRDDNDRTVVISTHQGGGKLNNGLEVRKHLQEIIRLLNNENDDRVRKI